MPAGWVNWTANRMSVLLHRSPEWPNSVVFPHMTFDGQHAITGFGNAETANTDYALGIAIVNNWLWTKGQHMFNIGGRSPTRLRKPTVL